MEPPVNDAVPIYDTVTLNPLSPPTASPSTSFATPSRSPLPDSSEPYSVFRNEISLESAYPDAVEIVAPDFFSLEVGEEEPMTPSGGVAELKTELKAEQKTELKPEAKLESSWFRGNSRFRSPMLQLHKEIVDFCDFLSPTLEEETSRRTAIECVSNVIKYIWPTCKVEVFGSFKTGLYLPTSDIDVVILGSGIKNPQMGLHALSRALTQKGVAKKIQVIAKARVPIIKFVEKKSGFSFDISFDVYNGPLAADIIKEAISKWPPVRPLCLILKVFLQQRELNEVYKGGIGSYALLTMLMAVLQNLKNSQASPEHNLGVLLVHFFDFFGRKLNTANVAISSRGPRTFFPKQSKGFLTKGRPFLIAIEDPQAPDNDIGKNSFNYFQIRSAFSTALSTLTNSKVILSLGPNRSILGTIIRPDPALLERKGGYNGDVTFNSLLPGAGEPLESQNGNHQEFLCNWQLNDEEEALPRGEGIFGENSGSGKKRKGSSKDDSHMKRLKENGEFGKVKREENNSFRKEKDTKKQRWRRDRKMANGFGGSPWSH